MPPRIVVDDAVPEAKRPRIVEAVRTALGGHENDDDLLAVVSRLPNGRLRVYVNHVEDPNFVAMIEEALSRL